MYLNNNNNKTNFNLKWDKNYNFIRDKRISLEQYLKFELHTFFFLLERNITCTMNIYTNKLI